jgi:chorismate synthase
MLAVRPEMAGAGLATRLKAFQRDAVLARDVRRMVWTFDPLRARNAHLNLTKLGATVRSYRRDMYGDTDSVLHRGIGTDRFLATWALDSARVVERLSAALTGGRRSGGGASASSDAARPEASALTAVVGDGPPRPGSLRLDLEEPRVGVDIPSDIGEVMARAPEAAVAWRGATRAVFEHYFSRGYEARELLRASSLATYVLEPTPPEPSSTGASG